VQASVIGHVYVLFWDAIDQSSKNKVCYSWDAAHGLQRRDCLEQKTLNITLTPYSGQPLPKQSRENLYKTKHFQVCPRGEQRSGHVELNLRRSRQKPYSFLVRIVKRSEHAFCSLDEVTSLQFKGSLDETAGCMAVGILDNFCESRLGRSGELGAVIAL